MQFKSDYISLKGNVFSIHLDRNVAFRLVAPPNYKESPSPFPVLLMNDGQDYVGLNLEKILSEAYRDKATNPFVYVGIEADKNRLYEYGTSISADFKGRGNKALQYSKFIIEEFVPFLCQEFKVSPPAQNWVYCGFSLGGLSAFDIVFNNSQFFGKVGVFSGSFWWRKKPYQKNDKKDRSRITLEMIKNADHKAPIQYFFQCGTEEETEDRNNNGIIDVIDDTMDVISELQLKGYSYPGDIYYKEIDGGKHDLSTWSAVLPQFFKWSFQMD
ncbi:esterase [Arenibacter sp. N53]|uniref:alpha/beta hydrolase n=1 Tax=Arenibacter TaxID=178469 RepID=UPI000CD3D1E9|nr:MULTISPECIES: alpha/beta hydrolase-fold protein [Arenibacter]MCM4150400.1 esterase [Arenibacter sp. N53]